jgi:DNA repair protein RAD16
MKRPGRKAAEEGQKRVRKLLEMDPEAADDSYMALSEPVEASDNDHDEHCSTKAMGPIRSRQKRPRAGNEPSNVSIEMVLKQNVVLVSETEDSDFLPDEQPSGDENIDVSDDEEISSDQEARTTTEKSSRNPNSIGKLPKRKADKSKKKQPKKEDKIDLNWEKWEKELDEWKPWGDDGEINLDALAQKKGPVDVKEPPPELLMPLLPFQKEWLAWSLKQEESEFKGGILADEMGMGKTIQAISLVVTSRALRSGQSLAEKTCMLQNTVGASTSDTKVLPQVKATLVVCPMVAVIQWRNEIARFTAEGSTKVLVYHGANRCKNVAELCKYDFVLTTYSIVEIEHRKHMMPAKEKCQWCNRLYYPDRLAIHLRFFCGPTAVKTEKQAKQIKKKGENKPNEKMSKRKSDNGDTDSETDVRDKKMKGKQKSKTSIDDEDLEHASGTGRKHKSQMKENDGYVEGKGQRRGRRKKNVDIDFEDTVEAASGSSILHSVKWDRIILDEAHFIKDRRCNTSKAVFSLQSSYKWALSGTPLQNRVGELYSLVRFLEIYPYSYYFCKKCDCKSLDYSFGKHWRKCDHCGHSPLHHFCWWNKYVANPIKKWGYKYEGRKALILLKYKVLDSIVLRRTKSERAADLALPPRVAFLRRDAFDSREEDFYQALYTQSQSQFNTYITAGTLLNNYAHIFDLLTRLRQAVDHPYLVVYSKTSTSLANDQNSTFDSSTAKNVCSLCNDESDDPVSASCGHTFCRGCIQEYTSTSGQSLCPSCLKPLTIDFTGRRNGNNQENTNKIKGYKRSSILSKINLDEFQTSTKIDALREEIALMLQKDAAAKAIVFSQFTSFLDLIIFSLRKSGIKCTQLTGSMSIQARDQTIEKFSNDPDCKVFLMSLKAGGVALNLTVASHVFLMDPWWNPAVEQQAQDRIHRLGQYKPIRVVRFVIANTIEERILRLQEKKQLVFEGTVGGSSEALGRLTEDDLRFLFTN